MRVPRVRGLVPTIVVGSVLLFATAAGAATFGVSSPTRATANSVTYQDSTGEDPQGPDITTITVSNTDAGMLSFRIDISNRPTLGQDMAADLFVDTDNNTATGSPDLGGTDYVLELLRGEANLYKWDGTNFVRRFGDPSAVTLSYSYANGVTFRISAAELGNTKKLNFFVIVESGLVIDPVTGDVDSTNAHGDVAPGGGAGLYPFEVKTAPPKLIVKKLVTSPAKPVAGKLFSAKLTVTRSDTGAVLKGGQVTCVGRAGGVALRAKSHRFVGNQAVCTWSIPAKAKGKSFRGSVAVVFEGLRAAKGFTGAIG
jgi:hypothetical protein